MGMDQQSALDTDSSSPALYQRDMMAFFEASVHSIRARKVMRHRLMQLFGVTLLVCVSIVASGCSQKDSRVELLDVEPPVEVGCLRVDSIRSIQFDEGSAFLIPDEFRRSSVPLPGIWKQERGYFIVEGHVDNHEAATGDGQRLSQRRAEVVASALENLGVPRGNIIPVGRSNTQPESRFDQGRSRANRRVEIIPTHWGWTCREHMLIRYTMFLTLYCQGEGASDLNIRLRCEQTLNRLPSIHHELLRTGKIGENR
jgi:flagellar motor protein MotB